MDPMYDVPRLPSLKEVIGPSPEISANSIFKILQAPQGKVMDIMPRIEGLLMGPQAPAITAIRQGAQMNRASAQSDAMKRGLTGSDIEAANMNMATVQGEAQVGQMIAAQSSALAQYIMQAYGLDVNANREQFVTLAQAIGQELSAQREMENQRAMRELMASEGAANRRNALWGAGISAAGNILGGAAGNQGGFAAAFSDRTLKTDIKQIGSAGGVGIYKYRWNGVAKRLFGKEGTAVGVLAQEVAEKYPHLVGEKDGYKTVNLRALPPVVQLEVNRLEAEYA